MSCWHFRDCSWRLRWSPDRKSTRLNSSHLVISYAVFCLKKKIKIIVDVGSTNARKILTFSYDALCLLVSATTLIASCSAFAYAHGYDVLGTHASGGAAT